MQFARDNKPRYDGRRAPQQGGQAFRKGGIVLDMRRLQQDRAERERAFGHAQPGATWHDIQNALHPLCGACHAIDRHFQRRRLDPVNAHGMDHQAGALAKSIKSMRVMLADGLLKPCRRPRTKDLFNLVVGGYGLFGVIVEASSISPTTLVYQTGRRL